MFGISDFTASDGWLSNFKKRHNLVFKKNCGESASVDEGICNDWQMILQDLLCEYDPKNVFNADETGLFFKCLPDRTLTFKNEKCHGGKLSKERVTLLFAVNMDGPEKLRPLFIGKSAKPRCFKNVKSLPVTYRNNKKSWMTTELWNEWLETFNNDMRKQHRKIIIFVDNCTAHNNPPTLSNVRIEFLPANTTSKLQSLDQGIIKNFKLSYRKEIVFEFLACLDNNDSPKVIVLTAIMISHKAWNNVTTQTIRNCFRKCGFVKTIDNEEEEFPITLEVDTQHNTLSTVLDDQLTLEDYVAIDDDLAVCVSLTDDEIFASFNNEEGNDEENDEEESFEDPIVTSKEAKLGLRAVLSYLQRHDIDDSVFSSILNLYNTIDKVNSSSCKQSKISDFFKK
ncbi:tigger transposable element-derived protein 6-like [Rhopalosiphum padi]|uniref:tigger transposable element-derived protein 6-like n=1 Tax=Rhopalosiphum padi TaxID=40932 RepID=UPI00298D7938|nr:tigger transposable element-derived protein 6-like [Rhopalosiphum padi]